MHEALLALFRNRPRLAAELIELALKLPLPQFTDATVSSADFTEIKPAEYRADLVVLLHDQTPVFARPTSPF